MNLIVHFNQGPELAPALVPILLDAALKSVLVLVAAGAAVLGMKRCSAAARHLVLCLAVASLLVLPALSWALPGWHVLPYWVQVPQRRAATTARLDYSLSQPPPNALRSGSRDALPEILQPELPLASVESDRSLGSMPPPATPVSRDYRHLGLVAWLAGALLGLLPTALGSASLWRLARSSRRETETAWLDLLRQLAAVLTFRRRVALLKSRQRRMPMTWGILRPKLLLPEESQEWPEERRHVVLLHELAHAKRWDYLTNLITQLACALYWFNPLVWIVARQLVTERERACDDLVLRHGAKPADYAEQVLEIAARLPVGRFAGLGAIPMTRPSKLEGRLRAILDGKRNRAALTRAVVIAALVLLTAVVVPVAMMKAGPAPSTPKDIQTDVVVWQAIVPKELVRQLGLTNPSGSENSYNAYGRDGTALKGVLRNALRDGADIEVGKKLQWLEPRESRFGSLRPFDILSNVQLQESPGITRQTATMLCSGHYAFAPQGTNVALNLQFTVNGQLQRLKPDRSAFEFVETKPPHASIEWRSSVPAGEALCFVARLAGTLEGQFYHLVAFETISTFSNNAARNRKITRPLQWLGRHLPEPPPGYGPEEVLELQYKELTPEDFRLIASKPRLKRLDLSFSSITDDGLRSLTGLKELEWLDLSRASSDQRPRLTDAGLIHLTGLTRLRTLQLHGQAITDAGLEQLAGLPKLEKLQLGATRVTGEALRHFTNLTWLRLDSTPLNEAGLRRLGKLISLDQLYLGGTSISDAGLAHLQSLQMLQSLSLEDTRVTPAGVAALKQALPGLVVAPKEASSPVTNAPSSNPQPNESLVTSAAVNVPPLERKVSLHAQQMPLKDALAELCRQAKVELDLDEEGLKSAQLPSDLPITMSLQDSPLDSVLWRLGLSLRRQGFWDFTCRMRGERLFVSSAGAELQRAEARTVSALPDWLKPLHGKGVRATLDDDGNVVSIHGGEKVDDEILSKLKMLPKLRELDLQGIKNTTREGLAHLAELPALEKLRLYSMSGASAGLGDDVLRFVARIKTLRDLSVTRCGLSDGGARALETMTQLMALSLQENPITDMALTLLAGLTNLQKLDLSIGTSAPRPGLMEITDIGLRHLSGLTRLEELHVNGLRVSGRFIAFPRLQVLAVSGEQFSDTDFDSILQCRDLRRLRLDYTGVSDVGFGRIAALKELRQLDLNSRVITDEGIKHLKALPKLEYLWLRAGRVSDESLRHLSEIKSLATLYLFGSGESGVSVGRLFSIQGLQQLKELPRLHELSLWGLQSPVGFLGLRELSQLRALRLDFTNIKEEEKELLERAMPSTSVSIMSGRMENLGQRTPARATLPSLSVYFSGGAVDAATSQPLTNCMLQFGAADPVRPGEVIWGEALPKPTMEASGNDPRDPRQFWGESFRTGKVWARVLAGGYAPEWLTPNPVESPLRRTNLVVRMKHGGDLRGVVVDHVGNPVPDMRLYLADNPYFSLRDGVPGSLSRGSTATTDSGGRFALPGGNGTEQKVVVASADGHMVWIVSKVDPGHEIRVSLPQPATLIARYDIPDDTSVAQLILNFVPPTTDPSAWKGVRFGINPTVTNREEVVLTNLTPGAYRLVRRKMLSVGGTERWGGGGRPGTRVAWLDEHTLTLEPGQTRRVDLARAAGQSVRGEVAGITEKSALGAYLYAFSAQTTNGPADMLKLDRPLDALTCGKDGLFQTARLEPGAYTVVAVAYKEPAGMGFVEPSFMGTAKVIISADTPPLPVNIDLLPAAEVSRTSGQLEGAGAGSPKSEVRDPNSR